MEKQADSFEINRKWSGRILASEAEYRELTGDCWDLLTGVARKCVKNPESVQYIVRLVLHEATNRFSKEKFPVDIASYLTAQVYLTYARYGEDPNDLMALCAMFPKAEPSRPAVKPPKEEPTVESAPSAPSQEVRIPQVAPQQVPVVPVPFAVQPVPYVPYGQPAYPAPQPWNGPAVPGREQGSVRPAQASQPVPPVSREYQWPNHTSASVNAEQTEFWMPGQPAPRPAAPRAEKPEEEKPVAYGWENDGPQEPLPQEPETLMDKKPENTDRSLGLTILNAILGIITAGSVAFLVWQTGIVQKLFKL